MSARPVVIVTGGAGGIGSQLCELYARDGYAVAVADLDEAAAVVVAKTISESGGSATGVRVDVTDEASTLEMAAEVDRQLGGVDILVNNAGLFGQYAWTGPVLGIDTAQWDAVMEVNVKGPLLCARAVAPIMRRAQWGRIINVSSQGAYMPAGAYSASKIALNQLTWNLARELGRDHITVNGIGPGSMDVAAAHQAKTPEQIDASIKRSIVRRLGKPADIYAALKYFSSRESEWCTGQTLLVNGGFNVLL